MNRCHHFVLAAFIALSGWPLAVEAAAGSEIDPPGELRALAEPPASDSVADATSEPDVLWPRTWQLRSGATFRLRGRVDTDAIWSHQSPADIATFGDLGDVVGLRRARIGAEGVLGPESRYIAEIDLASGNVVPRDVYLAYGDIQEIGQRQLGHFREPFSLEGGTSARYFAFMERSPINVLDPARNWGLGLFRESLDERTALGIGVFHAGTDPGDFQGGDGSTVGFTGRLTSALVNEEDGRRLLHLGLALSERVPEQGVILINQEPRSPLLDLGDSSTSPFVPVIRIPADFQQLINVQFAAANGPWWTQAEWYGSLIDQLGGGPVFFHGFHVDAGYFFTGEHRNYEPNSGMLGAVRVNRPVLRGLSTRDRPHGWGAWEVAARFTYLDFVDSDTPLGPDGQELGILLPQSTLGVNWYLCDQMRLMFNYTYAIPDDQNTGTSAASLFATRLGVFW